MIQVLSPDQFLAAQETLRANMAKAAPEVQNLGPALDLVTSTPAPLVWDGVGYQVRLITFPEGLELQKLSLALQRVAATEEDVEAQTALYDRACELFHSFLSPQPAENPFHALVPSEVGALLGFFSAYQTRATGLGRFQASRLASRSTT